MEKIKIHFCDFWKEHTFENDFFVNILKNKYEIVEDSKDPDFVLCSCFGREYEKYSCPRIFYSGENLTADFNVYDYAIGFDYLDFGKRYLRVPVYYFLSKLRNRAQMPNNPQNREFCSFLYSNGAYCDEIRIDFFKKLSKYKKINSSGALLNNTGKRVRDKISYLNNFKFTIAFENSCAPGYITEKICDAFIAATVPIYWGDPLAKEEFNPEAFIFANDCKNLDELAERVIEIDNNDELYLKMLNAPKVLNEKINDEMIISFFDDIFKNKGKILRKDVNKGWSRGEFFTYSFVQRKCIKKIKEIFSNYRS